MILATTVRPICVLTEGRLALSTTGHFESEANILGCGGSGPQFPFFQLF